MNTCLDIHDKFCSNVDLMDVSWLEFEFGQDLETLD